MPIISPDGLPASSRREQELSHRIVEELRGRRKVAQHHTCASEYTARVLANYDVTPIVMVRDIHDCMVSLAEHISRESPEIPWAYFTDEIRTRSLEYRIDAVVDLVSAWYLKFYASWVSTRPDAIFRYEDVVLDGPAGVYALLARSGLVGRDPETFSVANVHQAAEAARGPSSRLNVGVSGRGDQLSAENRKMIRRFASHYPDVDFGPIGL